MRQRAGTNCVGGQTVVDMIFCYLKVLIEIVFDTHSYAAEPKAQQQRNINFVSESFPEIHKKKNSNGIIMINKSVL